MKKGDYLISKVDINIPTWRLETGNQVNIFNIVKNERCEIVEIRDKIFPYIIVVKCRGQIIGFSLVDMVLQQYEYYQKYFYEYGTSLRTIRKEKLEKLETL